MTERGHGFSAVAMYPFPGVTTALNQLWSRVRHHLGFGPQQLSWDVDLHGSWRRSDLLLGQTCGWPLVSQLGDSVEVVGVFDATVPEAHDGTYRSVLVSCSVPLAEQLAGPRLRVAVNNDDSLSGYVSLRTVFAEHGRHLEVASFTGAHLASVRALAEGDADLASVDAVSWALIGEAHPSMVSGLHVIGHGPRVPCLPLITAAHQVGPDGRPVVDHLREALSAACAEDDAAPLLDALHARGFRARTNDDYQPLLQLAGAL
jgi:ABC-type phosphate/phosphonate transport system substrate-binding protein